MNLGYSGDDLLPSRPLEAPLLGLKGQDGMLAAPLCLQLILMHLSWHLETQRKGQLMLMMLPYLPLEAQQGIPFGTAGSFCLSLLFAWIAASPFRKAVWRGGSVVGAQESATPSAVDPKPSQHIAHS